MGSGITQVAAVAGYNTILYDVNEQILQNAANKLGSDLTTLVEKGKMDAATKASVLENITFTSEINHCVADLVVEAIIEKMEAKVALFQQLAIDGAFRWPRRAC